MSDSGRFELTRSGERLCLRELARQDGVKASGIWYQGGIKTTRVGHQHGIKTKYREQRRGSRDEAFALCGAKECRRKLFNAVLTNARGPTACRLSAGASRVESLFARIFSWG
jgi:hypothetical protein